MAYTLTVELHPLGIVVLNDEGGRELLIEGESCCGVSYEGLKKIALTNRRVDVEDASAYQCRLKRPLPECC